MIRKKQEWIPISRRSGERERRRSKKTRRWRSRRKRPAKERGRGRDDTNGTPTDLGGLTSSQFTEKGKQKVRRKKAPMVLSM